MSHTFHTQTAHHRAADTDCSRCKGTGEIVKPHPRFGSRSCPTPTIEVVCPLCDGTGLAWAGVSR